MKMKIADLCIKVNKNADLFFNLWERWQDESEYEDINEYLEVFQKTFPEAYAITKRPFGIKCKTDEGNVHVTVKRSGDRVKLCITDI